jgi:hypothetical protein
MRPDEPLDDAAAERAEAMAEREALAPPRDAPFTPRQILGGFALLAALVMLLRRKRREPDRDDGD